MVVTYITETAQNMVNTGKDALYVGKDIVVGGKDTVVTAVANTAEAGKNKIVNGVSAGVEMGKNTVAKGVEIGQNTIEYGKSTVAAGVEMGKNTVNKTVEVTKNTVGAGVEMGKNTVAKGVEVTKNTAVAGKDLVVAGKDKVVNTVKDTAEFGKTKVVNSVEMGKNAVVATAEFGKNAVVTTAEMGKNAVVNTAEFGKNVVVGGAEMGKNAVVTTAEMTKNAAIKGKDGVVAVKDYFLAYPAPSKDSEQYRQLWADFGDNIEITLQGWQTYRPNCFAYNVELHRATKTDRIIAGYIKIHQSTEAENVICFEKLEAGSFTRIGTLHVLRSTKVVQYSSVNANHRSKIENIVYYNSEEELLAVAREWCGMPAYDGNANNVDKKVQSESIKSVNIYEAFKSEGNGTSFCSGNLLSLENGGNNSANRIHLPDVDPKTQAVLPGSVDGMDMLAELKDEDCDTDKFEVQVPSPKTSVVVEEGKEVEVPTPRVSKVVETLSRKIESLQMKQVARKSYRKGKLVKNEEGEWETTHYEVVEEEGENQM